MESSDAPYLLVSRFADALAKLLKVRSLVDQAQSFEPKLRELGTYLSTYGEVRNELGRRLLSGRIKVHDLALIRQSLLSMSEVSDSLDALARRSEAQFSTNLPALACEIAVDVDNWKEKASQNRITELDETLECGRALETDIASKIKMAGELDAKLSQAQGLLSNIYSMTDGQHPICKGAAGLLADSRTLASGKLNDMLAKAGKWCDDHAAFSKDYEKLLQNLPGNLDEIDRMMAAATDPCRQRLADYFGQVSTWSGEVRALLNRVSKIASHSALALGEHPNLQEKYGDSQNLIDSLRSTITEFESGLSDEANAEATIARRKANFAVAILGILGAGVGIVWLDGHVSMFAVALVIVAYAFLRTRAADDDEPCFWSFAAVPVLGLCAVGVLLAGIDGLLGWMFHHWSLIGWLPKWVIFMIPVSFRGMLALGYAATMDGLFFRNFLPLEQDKPQIIPSPHDEIHAEEDSGPSLEEVETIRPATVRRSRAVNGRKSRLARRAPDPKSTPTPPPLPPPSRPAVKAIAAPPPPSGAGSAFRSPQVETGIPEPLLTRIRDRVKRQYRGDAEAQRDELETQVASYRAMQDLLAELPDGLDGQTMANIVSHAQREYPLDLQMQVHEIESQIEGHAEIEHFSDNANHREVPDDIWKEIVRTARREYTNNFVMQSHELQEQITAYNKIIEMRTSPPAGMNRKRMAKAIAHAEKEYPQDYSMQVYLIEQAGENAD